MSPSPQIHPNSRGLIVPIGGAEEKEDNASILQRFVEECGGAEARIAVIPTASQLEDTGTRYVRIFERLGAGEARSLEYRDRSDTEDPRYMEYLLNCTGIFMTGGNQLRLSTILGGTEVAVQIRRMNARGVHVGGTSAGAAFCSEHMIAYGSSDSSPKAGSIQLAPGLGLTNSVLVDQHFRQRDRLSRLMTALAYNPFVIGLGLDEDTGAFLNSEDTIEVVGSGAITIVDVSDLEYSGIASTPEDQPVNLIGVKLHILTEGATYNLRSHVATPPVRS
ncbi:MAG: cyanophycinase [Deltaproteobacteria bacterium]|nr:MAG: cyanophycinase [Deltaproteobacteria bacterium]